MKLNLYEIRYCRKDEYEKLVEFFRNHWREDHIFCKSMEIFEFQHGRAENGFYDFVVAVHKETGEFHAVLGFIRSTLYDKGEFDNPKVIYGALWKVRDDIKNSEIGKLGLGVLFHLIKAFPESVYITLGLSECSQFIYQALHYDFGKMRHYYIPNVHKTRYEIMDKPELSIINKLNSNIVLKKLEDAFDLENEFFPNKNVEYIRNRYLRHPIYKYELLGVFKNGRLVCEWVTRKFKVGDANCVRIIDMVGSLKEIGNIYNNVNAYLEGEDAEYIDCYNYGVDPNCFFELGFAEKKGDTVVPNYFEPFEKTNVDIYYATDSKKQVVIFKGDADQDRPNIL